jgi:hypothetical protein
MRASADKSKSSHADAAAAGASPPPPPPPPLSAARLLVHLRLHRRAGLQVARAARQRIRNRAK